MINIDACSIDWWKQSELQTHDNRHNLKSLEMLIYSSMKLKFRGATIRGGLSSKNQFLFEAHRAFFELIISII